MQTTLIGPEEIRQHAPIADVVEAVERAFRADGLGTVRMPAKSYVELPEYNGDFRAMPAYLATEEWDAAGVKWVNVHPDNPAEHALPTVMGIVVYTDPETGFPRAVLDGTMLTRLRTGAAAAVATDYLAREDATSLGVVGAGVQAYTQVEAIATVRDVDTVVVHDVDAERAAAFVDHFEGRFDCRAGTAGEAAACDICSTVTPVSDPVVTVDMLGDRTHVNAIGADAAGKQELDAAVLEASKLVLDDFEQCTHSGEVNVPWSNGRLSEAEVHAELGAIVAGNSSGREPDDGVTVFDSTGLAIQDIATARSIYERLHDRTDETTYRFVDTEL